MYSLRLNKYMTERKIVVVGAVIHDSKTDSYFVGKRSEAREQPLKWEFIGGKKGKGDKDIFAALIREGLEELKILLVPKKLVDTIAYNYGGNILEINFIECATFTDQPILDPEVYATYEWIPRNKLIGLDWLEADRKFAEKLSKM